MRTRTLGSADLVVSVVGLGCNNFGSRLDAAATRSVVDAAIEAGITLFDTAESYGAGQSEVFLGQALAGRREQVVLASKFGWGKGLGDTTLAGGSRAYIRAAVEASLSRLGTDFIDLYQYHRPDGVTPLEETLGALDELVQEGKVRQIGSSNFSAAQIREADRLSGERGLARFVAAQNKYSWLERDAEAELLPVCAELDVGVIPYFPLASGLLSGKYRRGRPLPEGTRLEGKLDIDDATWERIESLASFAEARGLGLLDVAIGGLAAQPAVASVIAGAMTPDQVRANVAAGEWLPTSAELDELRSL